MMWLTCHHVWEDDLLPVTGNSWRGCWSHTHVRPVILVTVGDEIDMPPCVGGWPPTCHRQQLPRTLRSHTGHTYYSWCCDWHTTMCGRMTSYLSPVTAAEDAEVRHMSDLLYWWQLVMRLTCHRVWEDGLLPVTDNSCRGRWGHTQVTPITVDVVIDIPPCVGGWPPTCHR